MKKISAIGFALLSGSALFAGEATSNVRFSTFLEKNFYGISFRMILILALGAIFFAFLKGFMSLCKSIQDQNIDNLQKSAKAGNSQAQYQLGRHYECGDQVPKDPAQALAWYRLAARQGSKKALRRLVTIKLFGKKSKEEKLQITKFLAPYNTCCFSLSALTVVGFGIALLVLERISYDWMFLFGALGAMCILAVLLPRFLQNKICWGIWEAFICYILLHSVFAVFIGFWGVAVWLTASIILGGAMIAQRLGDDEEQMTASRVTSILVFLALLAACWWCDITWWWMALAGALVLFTAFGLCVSKKDFTATWFLFVGAVCCDIFHASWYLMIGFAGITWFSHQCIKSTLNGLREYCRREVAEENVSPVAEKSDQ